jgi:hypothetical protein
MIIVEDSKKMQLERARKNFKDIFPSHTSVINEDVKDIRKYKKICNLRLEISMKICVLKSEEWLK